MLYSLRLKKIKEQKEKWRIPEATSRYANQNETDILTFSNSVTGFYCSQLCVFPAKSIVTKQFVVHKVDIPPSSVRRYYYIILLCVLLHEAFKNDFIQNCQIPEQLL
jgi:hypothetical protein